MGLMQSLLRKDRQASEAAPKPQAADSSEAAPLIILVPDAQGIATYQLHEFRSAKAAEIFVDVTLRGQVNERTVTFWALNGQPADGYAEPLVLIRDTATPVVYLFSFADLSSCHDFIRHEMTRGLELSQVMVYWAVPAAVDRDIWGRAVVTPGKAPEVAQAPVTPAAEPDPESRRSLAESPPPPSVLPFVARQESPETARYLTEADIADTIREMHEFTSRFDAEKPDVIDFPAASRSIRRSRKAARAAAGWGNFAHALDEALDVYVSHQVRVRIAINRIVRALAQAGFLHAATSTRATRPEPQRESAVDVSRAWARASVALGDAATIAIRRALMRRVWMNTAWTLEEAAYAFRLETRSRVSRGWRFASEALAQAAKAREERDAALAQAWAVISSELVSAADTQVATEVARRAWANATRALRQATAAAKRRQKTVAASWTRLSRALKQAAAAYEKERKAREKAEIAAAKRAEKAAAWAEREAARAAKRAADATRKAEMKARAALEATHKLPAAEEEDLSEAEQISRWLARQESEQTHEEAPGKPKRSRWEPHEEPFQGFRSPPGRF